MRSQVDHFPHGGGRVVRRCWVNFQFRGVLLIWIIVGQGPIALAVGAGGGCLDIFSLNYPFSPLSPSLWETARYRLKYCLKGPLNPKQPTNQIFHIFAQVIRICWLDFTKYCSVWIMTYCWYLVIFENRMPSFVRTYVIKTLVCVYALC